MAYNGRLMLIKMDIASVDTTIAGLRDTSITINEQEVDVTTKDDAGIRQLLDGQILRSLTVSGSGVLQDASVCASVRTAAMAGTHLDLTVVIPGDNTAGGSYTGLFRITSFEESGAHAGEQQYSLSLASAGAVTFTPAS